MHPATIGPFRIERELGRGGMGEVFLATDTRLDRKVAIKALPAHVAQDPDRLARFQREAKVLASLNHPGIGAIYGLEEAVGRQYLILEHVEGETLADRLSRGPVPIDELIPLARHMAEALEVAHEKGIVHRDLKPGNVMVTPDGKVKVLDFGLARAEESTGSSTSAQALADSPTITSPARVHSPTIPGVIMGSAGYMSPEQARGKAVDKRSDIFSYGCVLYELLTGAGPFLGETATDSMGAILHREPDWKLLPPGTPPALTRLLRRCLAKDKANRLHDIADARLELESIGSDLSDASGAAPSPALHARAARLRTRERAAWLLLLMLALAVAAGSWLAGGRSKPTPAPKFRQVNVHREIVFRSRFAPDGKTVVFCSARQGNTPDIYIARPEAAIPESLGMQGSKLLSVSSQAELAVLTSAKFMYHSVFMGTLARMPMAGGAPRQLLESVHDADWTPDGSQLAIIREVGGKDRIEFPIGKVLCETSGMFSDLRFSPKGDRIAFFEHPNWLDDRGSVNVVDLAGKLTVIADGYSTEEGLAWSADGSAVLFSASGAGLDYAILAAGDEAPARVVYQIPGGVLIQDVAREGGWLLNQQTWGFGMAVHTEGQARDKDLTWLGFTNAGAISADGKLVAFDEEGNGMGNYYTACIRGTDGSPVVRLGDGQVRDLSHDAKWVLATVYSTPQKLIAYPTGPGEPVVLDRGEVETYTRALWFRDGKRILFGGAAAGKGVRFYVQDFKGGPPRAVTPELTLKGSFRGVLSADDTSILTLGAGDQWVIYPLDGGPPRTVTGLQPEDAVQHWNDDGTVLVTRDVPVPCKVERVNLQTGKREPFVTLTPNDSAGVTDMSPVGFTDDLKSCLYGYTAILSRLYVMEDHK